MSNKIIKAKDFMISDEEYEDKQLLLSESNEMLYDEAMFSDYYENIVIKIFGEFPDYSDDKIDSIWHEVMDAKPEDIFEYCLKQGIDVLGDDGEPVPPWRDIATMLKAIDAGLAELEKGNS